MFSEDLPGFPPEKQVEFRINLVLGAAQVATLLVSTAGYTGVVYTAAGVVRQWVYHTE